jgi:hypothetical protein
MNSIEPDPREVIKGSTASLFSVLGGLLIVVLVAGTWFFTFSDVISGLIILIIFSFLSYAGIRNSYFYSFYEDRLEIRYVFRTAKTMVIQKEEILVARYEDTEEEKERLIIHFHDRLRNKLEIYLPATFDYVYHSPTYKILRRLKLWGVELDIASGSKELKSVLNS